MCIAFGFGGFSCFLHRRAFTRRDFSNEERLHTRAFTQKSVYTQELLQSVYTKELLHRKLYTQQKLLDRRGFTHRNFYTAFTQKTQKTVYTAEALE